MQDIHIKIEAYGAIEKHLPAELSLSCVPNSLITDVLDQIKMRYPLLLICWNAVLVQLVKILWRVKVD